MRWHSKAALALIVVSLGGCAGERPKRGFRAVMDAPVRIGAPYRAGGRMWVPTDDRSYDAVGVASWYGAAHAGRPTANGERFDPDRISAAHPTLPLPSYVEITAIDTGRTILARVNDRGPFASGRIIDLSAGAAKLLGIREQGVARVRVRRVEPPESDRAALRAGRPARARPDASRATVAMLSARLRDGGVAAAASRGPERFASAGSQPIVNPGSAAATLFYVLVLETPDADRADGLAAMLMPIGRATVTSAGATWRVRLGPYADALSARTALESVGRSGYQGARIVRESAAGQEDR